METNRAGAGAQRQAGPEGIAGGGLGRQPDASEIEEAEAYERYLLDWNDPVLTGQRAADAEAEAEAEAIWQESRIGLSGTPWAEPEAEL